MSKNDINTSAGRGNRAKQWVKRNALQPLARGIQWTRCVVTIQDDRLQLVRRRSLILLVWSVILSTCLNATYAVLLWVTTARYVTLDSLFLMHFRNVVILLLGINVLGAAYLPRQSGRIRDRARAPSAWKVYEITVIVMTLLSSILLVLQVNPLYPLVDLSAVKEFLQNTIWFKSMIGGLVNLTLLLLIIYAALKIPIATGTATSFFGRVYINGRRVHEAIIGLIWIAIAAVLLIYGKDLDTWLGVFFLMFGMFLVGRDYVDVRRFAFLRDLHQSAGKENAGTSEGGPNCHGRQ